MKILRASLMSFLISALIICIIKVMSNKGGMLNYVRVSHGSSDSVY